MHIKLNASSFLVPAESVYKNEPENGYNSSYIDKGKGLFTFSMPNAGDCPEEICKNDSISNFTYSDFSEEYIFDIPEVRIFFIFMYTIVFLSCFIGNLMVILVVTLHWKMRSLTNFCLANLAVADLCVSLFCVFQNLSIYLMQSWVLGNVLCKLHFFVDRLSYTASILILVVMCIERYLAIIHPFQLTIISVWVISAIINSPRLYYINIMVHTIDNETEIICRADQTKFNNKTSDLITFLVLYIIPLLIISVLYTKIGIVLWKTSQTRINSEGSSVSSSSNNETQCFNQGEDNLKMRQNGSLKLHKEKMFLRTIFSSKRKKRKRSPPIPMDVVNNNGIAQHTVNCPFYELKQNDIENLTPVAEFPSNSSSSISATEPIILVEFKNQRQKGMCKKNSGLKKNKCTMSFNSNGSVVLTETTFTTTKEKEKDKEKVEKEPNLPNTELHCHCHKKQTEGNGSIHNHNHHNGAGTRFKRLRVMRGSKYGCHALQSRRRIIRMLIAIVIAFALCNLPFHARKLWQIYGSGYQGGSSFSTLFTVLSNLIMYFNSGINPILYAFFSKKFRASFLDVLCCRLRRSSQGKGRNIH